MNTVQSPPSIRMKYTDAKDRILDSTDLIVKKT